MKDGLKSDDDPGARYRRNDELRSIIESRVRDLDLFKTYQMMEFVEETIHQPLLQIIGQFLESSHLSGRAFSVPLCQQFVALLRLRYLGSIISRHLDDLGERLEVICIEKGYPWKGMMKQCKAWAQNFQSILFPSIWHLDENIKDSNGKSISKALRAEILETTWCNMQRELQAPFDTSMWCPIALQMIDELSMEAFMQTITHGECSVGFREKLYTVAAEAAMEIRREASKTAANSFGLQFASGVASDRASVTASQVTALKPSIFEGHSLNSKGLLARALEMLAYFDCNFLLDDHFAAGQFSLPIEPKKRFLMTKFEGFNNGSRLTSIPTSTDNCEKMLADINVPWYLVWQVVYVATAYAQTHFSSDVLASFSLQTLCECVGVDCNLAKAAIERGIRREKLAAQIRKRPNGGKSKKTTTKAKRSSAFGKPIRAHPIEISRGAPDEPLEGGWPTGWVRKVYERQSGASKGHRDRYWYTPEKKFKLRSMSDVRKFIAYFKTVRSEDLAWKLLQNKTG